VQVRGDAGEQAQDPSCQHGRLGSTPALKGHVIDPDAQGIAPGE